MNSKRDIGERNRVDRLEEARCSSSKIEDEFQKIQLVQPRFWIHATPSRATDPRNLNIAMLFGAVSNARARVHSFLIFASDLSRVHEIPRDNWPLIYFLAVAVSLCFFFFLLFFVVGPQV